MPPRRLAATLVRRMPVLLVVALLGGLIGYLTSSRTSTFRAQAFVYVGRPITTTTSPATTFATAALALALAPAVSDTQVTAAALKRAGIAGSADHVAAQTSAAIVPGTSLLVVSVADTNPLRSELLTNAVAASFAQMASSLPTVIAASTPSSTTTTTAPPTGTTGTSAASGSQGGAGATQLVTLYRTALLPTVAEGDDSRRYVVLGLLGGLAFAIAVVFLVDLTGLAGRAAGDIEDELDLPVLGVLPERRRSVASWGASGGAPGDLAEEAPDVLGSATRGSDLDRTSDDVTHDATHEDGARDDGAHRHDRTDHHGSTDHDGSTDADR